MVVNITDKIDREKALRLAQEFKLDVEFTEDQNGGVYVENKKISFKEFFQELKEIKQ